MLLFFTSQLGQDKNLKKKTKIIYFSNQEAVCGYYRLQMCVYTLIAQKQNQHIPTSTTH